MNPSRRSRYFDDHEPNPDTPTGREGDLAIDPDQFRDYCWKCGSPWQRFWIICERCGSSEKTQGIARPLIEVEGDVKHYPGPWAMIPWPQQGTVAIHGGPGSGKSTMASMLKPTSWITSEQEPKAAGSMFRRSVPDFMPEIVVVKKPHQVARALSLLHKGPVVCDSLTAFGLRDAVLVAHMLVNWAREHDDRALAVLQHTKGGEAAGYMTIPHLFDCIVALSPDPWGVRAFRIPKSRWCALDTRYWTFDTNGQIVQPDFTAAYSVEGSGGNYWLHPYPLSGSKWNGLLAFLNEYDQLAPRTASAAVFAGYMEDGFVVPMDWHERKRFAESNGLTWLDPKDYLETMTAHKERLKKDD